MIVVDTNVISYLYFQGTYSLEVEKILSIDQVWVAPLLWRSEFRNVIALYVRKKIITFKDSLNIMNQAEALLDGNEYTVSSAEVLKLVNESNCSAYDCEFISLAKDLDKFLITEDKKLLAAFPQYAMSIKEFCNGRNS